MVELSTVKYFDAPLNVRKGSWEQIYCVNFSKLMEYLSFENNRLLQFLLWKIFIEITKQMAFEHTETVVDTNHHVLIKSKPFHTSLISFLERIPELLE